MSMETYYKNYLSHHGIRGQKWGKKNGPPYPLGPGDHSASERKAGWRKSLDKDSNTDDTKEKFHLTDKQKKYLKIGAGVVAGCLIAYGGYQLHKTGVIQDYSILGRQKITRMLNKNMGSGDLLGDINQLSKDTGYNINQKQISIIQSTKKVNTNYNTGKPEYTANCFSAVTADIVNRLNDGHGLDVIARPATDNEIKNGGISFNEFSKTWKDSFIDDIVISKQSLNSIDQIKINLHDQIKEKTQSENSIGAIRIKLSKNSSIGHYIKYEIKNGEVYLSDSLSGTFGKIDDYLERIASGKISRGIEIMKCDGLEINSNNLKNMVYGGD